MALASKVARATCIERSLHLTKSTKHSLRAVSTINTFVSILTHTVDFDAKAFEIDCRKIVQDISDRFLDLGLDEGGHSDYGNLMQKQE